MLKTNTGINNVSIVIPVYNEEDCLDACLQAIAAQTTKPYEVLVVDNNSTDNTAAIAAQYDFVTVLHEPRQGVVFARNRGFDAARGQIIGRIDADTRIDRNWIASLQEIFSDEEIGVVTGKVHYNDVAFVEIVDAIDLRIRRRLARLLGREVAIQGANMALRTSVWRDIRNDVCSQSGMHEDFDLAIHATERDRLVVFDERLSAGIGYRQPATSYRNFCEYIWISPKTYALHGLKSRRHMYPVVAFLMISYPVISVLCRGYDADLQGFSWRKLYEANAKPRVNPATFVD